MSTNRTLGAVEIEREMKPARPKRSKGRFAGKRWGDITFDPDSGEWLVQGLLPMVGLAVFYGRKKVFKSFIALSLAAAIAARRTEWAGRAIKRYGAVVYIAGEGGAGVRKRIAGLKQAHDLDADLPFILIEARPNLGITHGDVAELLASIDTQLIESDGPPVLVIIDTLVRTLHGADENGDGMRNFADNAEQVAEHLGCLVIAVHHQGGRDGMRGHTSLPGASVANWHIEPLLNGARYKCRITIEDSKDGESGFALLATLRQHFFGDPENDPECPSTLVVESIEPGQAKVAEPKKDKRAATTLNALMTSVEIAMHRFGIEVRLPDNGPMVKAVPERYVRATYYGKRADLESADSKGAAFRRQLEKAIQEEALVSGQPTGDEAMLWRP